MIGEIFVVVAVALVIAGLVAPGEALGWWRRAGQGDNGIEGPTIEGPTIEGHSIEWHSIEWPSVEQAFSRPGQPSSQKPAELPPETGHYLVYLSGIGISSPEQLPVVEIPMVERLAERVGDTTLIWEIYPYSVANVALTQGRLLSRLWQRLAIWKFERRRFLGGLAFLINLRNAFQVFVSVDRRYGPVFNLAIAQQIAAALIRSGYVPEHRKPVTLLGWSGGAQIAAGATWYLAALGVDVRVLSMAGLLGSDPGLDRAVQIWHLRGDTDKVPGFATLLAPRRWRIVRNSEWNRARRDGRLKIVSMGPLRHTGAGGYFSAGPPLPDGRAPAQASADYILQVLVDAGLAYDNFAPGPASGV